MDEVKKYIDFSYLIGLVLVTWVCMKIVDALWHIYDRMPNPRILADLSLSTVIGVLVGIGLTAYLRLNPRVYQLATECGVELKKTIWPSWTETKSNTVVVIVLTFIVGFILWFFDLIWKNVTGLLYG
ncbi:MAG: preprotein translocase subunit SecE [Bradymonadales bacterium]|nr:preprotein translocase subunit SecE [Bradymonadales bacterium]